MHPAVRFLVLTFWTSSLCLPGAAAVERKRSSAPSQEGLTAVDASFVLQVIRTNWAELDFARLALQKATNPEVRRWAQSNLAAHEQANKEALRLAQQHRLSVPDSLDAGDLSAYFRLKLAEPGKSFDMSYLAASAENHSEMLEHYRLQAEHADNTAVRSFAKRMLQEQQAQLWQSKKMMVLLSQDRLRGQDPLSKSSASRR